jgi:hypothetical protein
MINAMVTTIRNCGLALARKYRQCSKDAIE